MPLLAPRISNSERVAQKIVDNPLLGNIFAKGLDGTFHFKILALPTEEYHTHIRAEWRDFTDFHPTRNLPAEIKLGAKMVSEGTVKEFVVYLAAGIEGRLVAVPTVRSVKHGISTFFACWARYASQHVSKEVRYQVYAFIDSLELAAVAPLSREVREKPIATPIDLDEIIRYVWNDKTFFHTMRAKAQFNGVNLIAALTGERPGGIIESTSYVGSNECLHWGDTSFIIVPNPDDPGSPFLALGLRFRNPKAHRGDPAHWRTMFLVMEPFGARAHCLVTILLYLALRDEIFANDVENVDQILRPEHPPTAKHVLKIKDSVKSQPIFRADRMDDNGVWGTSETKALRASTHSADLRKVCFANKFIIHLSMYSWRRAAANAFAVVVSDLQRDALLTHAPNTHMFAKAYQSRLLTHDLGGILHGRGEDASTVALTKSAASVGRAPGLPTKLDLNRRAELEREPELVAMRTELAKMKADIQNGVTKLKSIDPEDPDADELFAEQHGSLRSKRNERDQLRAKYQAIIVRETYARLKTMQKDHIDEASGWQLQGKAPPGPTPMALARPPLADKTRQAVPMLQHRVVGSDGKENSTAAPSVLVSIAGIDPEALLCDVLYRFPECDLATETIASVTAMLGAPERPFAACYPGESPTVAEKCPVCGTDCSPAAFRGSGSQTVGSHIHSCLLKAQQEKTQQYLEAMYKPRGCDWDGCVVPDDHTFATRDEFVSHMQDHVATLSLPPSRNHPTRECRMRIGEDLCLEDSDSVDSWEKHYGQVHCINIRSKVQVHYCAICPEWHVDELGDGLAWEAHLWGHWDTCFGPFSKRVQGDVDLTPIDVQFTAGPEPAVDFANGSGFGGKHPEFHGDVHHGVADHPMHCPWCVYDTSKCIERQMKQFISNGEFFRHLQSHSSDIDDSDEHQCPVPSCGTRSFSAFDFKTHLVAFHRVPVCGSFNVVNVRRLRLPTVPAPAPVPAVPVDLTHLTDVDPPAAESNLTSLQQTAKAYKKQREQSAKTAQRGHCYGCSCKYADIGKHIQTTKCRAKNEYQRMEGNNRVGPVKLKWQLTADAVAAEPLGAERRLHKCAGQCRLQFVDIRTHMNDAICQPTHFHIIDPNDNKGTGKNRVRNFGPRVNIADWVAEQVKKASEPGPSKRPRSPIVRLIS
ncbi:hypothetical protein B0H11DRAFT_2035750 [Mycena galericulata]|nr:hypothetical protein B0H11DRAFT_2035750 [Mycena galericulata]